MEAEQVNRDYLYYLGQPPSQYIQSAIYKELSYYETPPVYIKYALREAAKAPRPSWAYAMAIIKRLKAEHYSEDLLRLYMSV